MAGSGGEGTGYEMATGAVMPSNELVIVPVVRMSLEEPTTSTTAPPARHRHHQRGLASWFGAPKGTCAHRTIPKGTIVTVTRTDTRAETTCRVDDRGPADTTRVIDLSRDTFAKLAGADIGLIPVQIHW